MSLVRVVAEMAGPVVADKDIHLDGLLVWSAAQDLDMERPSRGQALSTIPPVPIPVRAVSHGGHDIYLCSAWSLSDDAEPWRHSWTRRRDAHDVECLARPFNAGYGPGRDLLRTAASVLARYCTWQVESDDQDEMRRLLGRITHLGGLRAHGLGAVLGWSIRESEGPPEWGLVDQYGCAARALPVSWLADYEGPPVRLAVQCPYWHPEAHVPAVAPGTPARLTDEVRRAVA